MQCARATSLSNNIQPYMSRKNLRIINFCSTKDMMDKVSDTAMLNDLKNILNSDLNSYDINSVYRITKEYLISNELIFDEIEYCLRIMLCEVAQINYRMSEFYKNANLKLTKSQIDRFIGHCEKRLNHVPLQYIIGNWEFFGLTFDCKAPILIPRPETEELISLILEQSNYDGINKNIKEKIENNRTQSTIRILDIGTGTGVIGITLLTQIPNSICYAIDINPDAINLANKNAEKNLGSNYSSRYIAIPISFENYIIDYQEKHSDFFDIIVSNPPYIPSNEILTLQPEVRKYEDRIALDGGEDGMDIIKNIILNYSSFMKINGQQELWMEVAREHPVQIRQWVLDNKNNISDKTVEIFDDITSNPRFVRIKRQSVVK
eukprot:gene7948-10784_t